ncbi:transposase [Mycobacterium sp. 852002-51163_SCH5372311]|uniref:transposase n=1 Tax=Mycobacterium sp. 852002-51163_SCH5372311 TaxID=1834097 RepID=UPI0009ED5AA5
MRHGAALSTPIHLLLAYAASLTLPVLVNGIEGILSSRLCQRCSAHARKYMWGNHFWSPPYFAVSYRGAPLTVNQCI